MHELLSSPYFIEWLPCNTLRYENTLPVRLLTTIIPSGLLDKQNFQQKLKVLLPEGWVQYVNCAEGRPYYLNSSLGIFTESNITDAHILNRLIKWARTLESLMNQSSGSDYDVVLKVSEEEGEGMGTCHYYLVDHTSKVIFWLREVSTSALGLSEVRSPTHLKLLLSEQYWTHCEYLPPPHKDFKQEAKELLATLGTLCIDASSSTGSVSPFHQDECESYSRALTQVISNGGPTEISWCLARLQSLLTQSRIINLHGEHNARADRNVLVNGQKAPPETILFMILSFIMFTIPQMYLARWNAVWVDRVTYTREWKKLTKDMIEEYTYSLIGSGIMLIASILLWGLSSSLVVRVLAAIAMLSSICGGFYSASLFSTLRSQGGSAADAANFIQMNEHITTCPPEIRASNHSIPWLSIIWSVLAEIARLRNLLDPLGLAHATINREEITRGMSVDTILTHLTKHGCKDITGTLDIKSSSPGPVSNGGFGDVYRINLRGGQQLAFKCARSQFNTKSDRQKYLAHTAHETYVWSKCQHPNVMQLIGVVQFHDQLAMVSPWLENGDLKSFIRDNPGVDRCALCTQVADGVAYLHGRGVIHGDLKAANILISHDQTVKITDFGNARLSEYSLQFHTSTKGCGVSPRWTAPEILEERTKTTVAADIYALGMTILEVITGAVPYDGVADVVVLKRILLQIHPARPESYMPTGRKQADNLWSLLISCWEYNEKARPTALKVKAKMETIKPDGLKLLPRDDLPAKSTAQAPTSAPHWLTFITLLIILCSLASALAIPLTGSYWPWNDR